MADGLTGLDEYGAPVLLGDAPADPATGLHVAHAAVCSTDLVRAAYAGGRAVTP